METTRTLSGERADGHLDTMLDTWRPNRNTLPVRGRMAALLLIRLWLQLEHPGKEKLLEGIEREIAKYIDHPAMKDAFEIFKRIKVQAFVNRVRRELAGRSNGSEKLGSDVHWSS